MQKANSQVSILPFIWTLIKPHKIKMAIGLIALISINLLLLTVPQFIARIIDTYATYSGVGTIDISRVIYLSLILFAVSLVIFGLRMLWRYFLIIPSYIIKKQNKELIFTHLLSLSPESLKKYSVGEQISLLSRETDQLAVAISWGTLSLFDGLITIVSVYTILLISYGDIVWASLLTYPLTFIFLYAIWSRIGKAYMLIQEHIASLSELTREMLQHIATIKSFNSETYYINRFLKKGNLIVKSKMYISLLEGLLWPLIGLVNGMAIILVIYFSITKIKSGQASLGDLSAVLNYLVQIQMPFMGLAFALDIQQKGMQNAHRIRDLLQTTSSLENPSNPTAIQNEQGTLEIKEVMFTYPMQDTSTTDTSEIINTKSSKDTAMALTSAKSSETVSKDLTDTNSNKPFTLGPISLNISSGTWLGITGKIGCGKSTLALLLPRLYDIDSGTISYDGIPINEIDLEELRSTILLQNQMFQLFSWSVAQNIVFNEDELNEGQLNTAIEYGNKSGLAPDVALFANRWDTQIGESGILLSGGQKQRVSLARALVTNAPILVLDDIFSGLDYKTALMVISNLKELRKNKTTILISHNHAILSNADTIVVMDEGKIVEQGTHKLLLDTPESLYAQSWHEYLITQGQQFE